MLAKILSQPLNDILRHKEKNKDMASPPGGMLGSKDSPQNSPATGGAVWPQTGSFPYSELSGTPRSLFWPASHALRQLHTALGEKRSTVVDRIAHMAQSSNPQFQLKAIKAIHNFASEGTSSCRSWAHLLSLK